MTNNGAPKSPDLPRVEKRPEGFSDQDYVEIYRARGPVAIDRYGFYWTFSHAHLLTCTDPNLTRQVETEKARALGITDGPIHEYFANSLLFSNGEVHQRRRRPLARAFAFNVMDQLRPEIRVIAEDLVHAQLGRGRVDFLGNVAAQLPARVIARILGAPATDLPRLSGMVGLAMRALSLRPSLATAQAVQGLADLDRYVTDLLADRRARPRRDFLSDFVAASEQQGLTGIEARVQIVSVILAGSDTTRMALCSTLSQLLQHPAQWAALVADPDGLKTSAVAEGLRFDPVIGSLPRVATCDFDLDGVPVAAGTVLAPIIVAVLRDPAIYADPARFDILRTDHPRYHPVFGIGAHRCLGEALARVELEEALSALAVVAPDLRLAGRPPTLSGVSGARTIDAMDIAMP